MNMILARRAIHYSVVLNCENLQNNLTVLQEGKWINKLWCSVQGNAVEKLT